MTCSSCAATIVDDARFCSACGHAVSSVSQAPTRGGVAFGRRRCRRASQAAVFVSIKLVQSMTPLTDVGFQVVLFGSMVFVLIRFGLVALASVSFVSGLFGNYPITWHLSAWYAPSGIFAIAMVAALAIYGFRTTLEGRPVLKGLLDNEA